MLEINPAALAKTELPTKTVEVIDFDITLASGKEFQFSVRPDLGDTERYEPEVAMFTFGRTKHEITVRLQHVAIWSRRMRTQLVLDLPEKQEAWKPTTATS